MENKYSIISVMGDKVLARDASGQMRDFEVSELIILAMRGVEFSTEPAIHQEIFCKFAKEIFILPK